MEKTAKNLRQIHHMQQLVATPISDGTHYDPTWALMERKDTKRLGRGREQLSPKTPMKPDIRMDSPHLETPSGYRE
jgi:hypothetical protein